MTRALQKVREKFIAEEAARLLGKNWHFVESNRECPDFLMSEDTHEFGLEVCEIFAGISTKKGSKMRSQESSNQRDIEAVRHEYEKFVDIALDVKLVGEIGGQNLSKILAKFVEEDFASKPIGYSVRLDITDRLCAHVTRSFRRNWIYVNDRVGFFDQETAEIRIVEVIKEKSKKLQKYRGSAGSDVRLLLFSDRHNKSGKLLLKGASKIDLFGFRSVYFFSYPENVTVFD